MTDQHLIVLRGNSGAGKTTLAQQLQLAMGRGTANIGQDHLRRVILREHDVPGGDNIQLIATTVRYCLQLGYHVIVEGIFFSGHYGDMLRGLIDTHTGPAHVFYLDVPLAETLRRHEGRPMRVEVGPDKLRNWYIDHDLLGVPDEVVLDHSRDLASTTRHILDRVGPITARTDTNSSRFL
ncbi:AAA family ATPase [Allobranchiibius sp. CTAmp26]|uniref:AAA family ATPase n=1 Tax=Allobranchiibius sp. CTAmp26 TaxID=2815214 RepID=UPI001AA1996B|nr:AAA family ATPase [Allobranchiibius sp. CTAmp26]MBO1756808.1 kinase [Allobranchiibius sp. CTAmp26]